MEIYSEYLRDVFILDAYKVTVANVANALATLNYDAIAFRGSSGAAVAFPLSIILDKPLIHIRKRVGHHSYSFYEGVHYINDYVIVDDFVDTGETLLEIRDEIASFHKDKRLDCPKCVGVVLYGLCADHYRLGEIVEIIYSVMNERMPVLCVKERK